MNRLLCLFTGVLCLAASVRADILPGGRVTSKQVRQLPTGASATPCSVLWYDATGNSFSFGTQGSEASRMASFGLNITTTMDASQVNAAHLADYAVLVSIRFTPGNAPGLSQAVIQSYVQSGHGLFIHQPNAPGPILYAPAGFEVTIASEFSCGFPGNPYFASIVDAEHPITSGLSFEDLSSAGDFVSPLGPGWTVLTRNTICHDPALAAGNPGSGRVVLDDGFGALDGLRYGTDVYWVNIFKWLCSPGGGVPTRHSTWGTLKASYR